MKKKVFIGAGVVLIVLLMVSSATAVNLTYNDSVFEKSVDEKDTNIEEQCESDNNLKGEKPAGIFFCILIVWAYSAEPIGRLAAPGVYFEAWDLDFNTGYKWRITGLFGYTIFWGLRLGHTYKITAPYCGGEEIIKMDFLIDEISFCVYGD